MHAKCNFKTSKEDISSKRSLCCGGGYIFSFLFFFKLCLPTVGTTQGNMTNLFDHLHQRHRITYEECKARTKFYPKQMSILDAYASCCTLRGSKCHVESTRKLNKCPSFSKSTPVIAYVINSFQIELQEFYLKNIF